jgi:hypothetical protein
MVERFVGGPWSHKESGLWAAQFVDTEKAPGNCRVGHSITAGKPFLRLLQEPGTSLLTLGVNYLFCDPAELVSFLRTFGENTMTTSHAAAAWFEANI